jgi:signal transduction histidine kinase
VSGHPRRLIAGRVRPATIDAVSAVGIATALAFELRDQTANRPLTLAAAALVAAPIAVRRRWPAAALVASSGVTFAQGALGGHLTAANGLVLPPILLAYGAGAWCGLRRGLIAVGAATACYAATALSTPTPSSASQALAQIIFAGLLCIPAWLVGMIARGPTLRADASRRVALKTAEEVAARERAASAEERARIRRELHDVIAHSVTAMVVQAGGARQVIRTDPDAARAAIAGIEHAGRETLADMRRLVGILRRGDDSPALAPPAGLSQLDGLIRENRARGVSCEVTGEENLPALSPGVDLVAFRVIEAALAGADADAGSTGSVTLRHDPVRLEIEVRGDWTPRDLGAIGDRVSLYDGRLEIRPQAHGFTLEAVIPLATTP